MKISTIIPVYNCSKYLNKCIDSIINQTIGFDNIELILVNDGSTDNSKKIIDKYLKKYPNIKYFEEKNSGQATARNYGLSKATGEYISFVDGDDWIDKTMYENMYNTDYDIITCDYTKYENNNYSNVSFRFINNNIKNFIVMNTGPCNMIIKNKFLKAIKFKFPEGIIYEDLASIPLLGIKTDKIKYIEQGYYYYNIHNNSTMNKNSYSKNLEDIFTSVDILYNNWIKYDKNKTYINEIEYLYIRRLLMSASLRFIQFNDPNKCINKISDLMHLRFPNWEDNIYYKTLPKRQKLVGKLTFNKNIKLLRLFYKIKEVL